MNTTLTCHTAIGPEIIQDALIGHPGNTEWLHWWGMNIVKE